MKEFTQFTFVSAVTTPVVAENNAGPPAVRFSVDRNTHRFFSGMAKGVFAQVFEHDLQRRRIGFDREFGGA